MVLTSTFSVAHPLVSPSHPPTVVSVMFEEVMYRWLQLQLLSWAAAGGESFITFVEKDSFRIQRAKDSVRKGRSGGLNVYSL